MRLDCIFLLTDEVSHRRARTEDDLMSTLRQVRPNGLDLPWVSPTPDVNSPEWDQARKVRMALLAAIDRDRQHHTDAWI